MIRDTIVNYLSRASDYVLSGRNRSRLVIGTDRKTTKTSGYGDGGDNNVDSGCLDLVAGFDPSSGDNDLKNDKSRIYVAEKTDPDEYFDITVGDAISGEPGVIAISDHIRIKGRKTIKIVGKSFSIIVNDQGEATMDCQKLVVSCPDVRLGSADASEVPAWASKVQSELQSIQRTLNSLVPATGAPVAVVTGATFLIPYMAPADASLIGASKTKIE